MISIQEMSLRMHRGKQIIYTTHCVLNQNSVIKEWERASGAFNDIIRVLLDYNISIIQLPCPEFTFLGESRPPKTKKEYNIPQYRILCKKLAKDLILQMKEYIEHDYRILGIVGIKKSPSCDTGGEKGIFMEEIENLLNKENIRLNYFNIHEEYIEGESKEIVLEFRRFIDKIR